MKKEFFNIGFIAAIMLMACNQVSGQSNSVSQINITAVCWTTPASVDSNLYAYWLLSSRETEPRVVSYLDAGGNAVVVAGGNLQNGFCCCSGTQDTLGITIAGDTLILVQNGETYTYIGGDDDWRWVDLGAAKTMYEAIYRMGKAALFTQDTSYGFRVDSTFRFSTDGNTAVLEWMRGDTMLNYKTLMFRAPGGTQGEVNEGNSITIASTEIPELRGYVGLLKFAAPFTGSGANYRTAGMLGLLDGAGGNDTTATSFDFWTRTQGESFLRNTMTLEGNGRLELDRYPLFQDGIPERLVGYENTDKDLTVHDIDGNALMGHVLGIAPGQRLEWKDPDTLFSPVNIYNSNGTLSGERTVTQGLNKLIFNSTPNSSGNSRPAIEIRSQDNSSFSFPTSSHIRLFNRTQFGQRDSSSIVQSDGNLTVADELNLNIAVPTPSQNLTNILGGSYLNGSTGAVVSLEKSSSTVYIKGDNSTIRTIFSVSPAGVNIAGSNVGSKPLRFFEIGSGSNFTSLQAPSSLSVDLPIVLPSTAGSAGQFVQTDGAGNWSYATPSSVNIYNANGSLTGSRTLTAGAGLNLTYDLSSTSTHILRKATGSGAVVPDLLRLQYSGTDNGDGGAIDFNFDYGGGNLSTGKIKSIVPSAGTSWLDLTGQGGFPTPTEKRGVRVIAGSGAGNAQVEISTAYLLPSVVGSAGQVMTTDGIGTASWQTPSSTATNLTFTGAVSPVTLNSSTGTDVTLTAGTGVSFSQTGNNLTINAPGDSTLNGIISALPAGDVTISTNENTLTFNTDHEAGDTHATMNFVTSYASDDFLGTAIRFVNTVLADTVLMSWYDDQFVFDSDAPLTLQGPQVILTSNDGGTGRLTQSGNTTKIASGQSGTGASVELYEGFSSGSNYTAIKASNTLAANWTLTLPTNDGSVGNILFNSDGNGTLAWGNAATGTTARQISGTTNSVGVLPVTLLSTPTLGWCTCTNNSNTPANYAYIHSVEYLGGTSAQVVAWDTVSGAFVNAQTIFITIICY